MHRHTGQGSAATADPVSSATVKRRSLLPLYYENKEQNASRFGICAGFRLGARYRSLGRNDAESLGFGRKEQPWGERDFYGMFTGFVVGWVKENHPNITI
jgi:hypothetical protein